jgi:predicted metal-dependent phosphoesterase TrpH
MNLSDTVKKKYSGNTNIDLHIHSRNSDGGETTLELLQRFKKYEIISFTDHDSVQCYYDLLAMSDEDLKGKVIVPGVELCYRYNNELRDILGYGIDVGIVKDFLEKRYPQSERLKKQQICLEKAKEVFRKKGLKFDEDIEVVSGNKSEAYVVIYNSLMKYPENIEKYGFIANVGDFYRYYYSNRESDFFVDESFDLPSIGEVIGLIHEAGGLAFLAHPCAYSKEQEEWASYIENAAHNHIDGIEVYHYSADKQAAGFLYRTAKEKDLFISGGSDFHQHGKHCGFGKTKVPYGDIKSWIESVELFNI